MYNNMINNNINTNNSNNFYYNNNNLNNNNNASLINIRPQNPNINNYTINNNNNNLNNSLNNSLNNNRYPTNNNSFEFNSFLEFKETLQKTLENSQFQSDWVNINSKIFGQSDDIVFRKCLNDSECRELLGLLKPGSYFFRIVLNNFNNFSYQFYFPLNRLPKNTIYKMSLLNQNSPKIIHTIKITPNSKELIVDMFQYYFFAFALFPDHINLEMPLIEQKSTSTSPSSSTSSSFLHQRTIHGIPTFSHNRQSTSTSTLNNSSNNNRIFNQQKQQQIISDRTKRAYITLLNEYLNYFLPFNKNPDISIRIDPFRTFNVSYEQSLSFLGIVCESLFNHNLTVDKFQNLPQFALPIFSEFKSPTPIYLDSMKTVLLHFHAYSYSFNFLTPSSLQSLLKQQQQQQQQQENKELKEQQSNENNNQSPQYSPNQSPKLNESDNNNDNNNKNDNNKNNIQITPELKLYFNQCEIINSTFFNFLLSFLERSNFNDPQLPIEKFITNWLYFITPWDPISRTTDKMESDRKKLTKNNSLQKIFSIVSQQQQQQQQQQQKIPPHSRRALFEHYQNTTDYLLLENEDYYSIWENFVTEHYYFYSLVFSLLMIKSSQIDILPHLNIFKLILKVYNSPTLKSLLKTLSTLDDKIIHLSQKQIFENKTLSILVNQLQLFDIKPLVIRNLFSDPVKQCAFSLCNTIKKKMNHQNHQDCKEFIILLGEFYDFSIPSLNIDQFSNINNNNNINSNNKTSSSNDLNEMLILQSPNRNKDGTLSDLGRRQIHDGMTTCRSDNLTYPYEKLMSNPIAQVKAPITNKEIGFFINLGYRYTDNISTRLLIRRYSRKSFVYSSLLALFIIIIILKLFF